MGLGGSFPVCLICVDFVAFSIYIGLAGKYLKLPPYDVHRCSDATQFSPAVPVRTSPTKYMYRWMAVMSKRMDGWTNGTALDADPW